MTSYLVYSGPMPFTGAELCGELGIDIGYSIDLDTLVAVEVIGSKNPCRKTIWWTSVGPYFSRETKHGDFAPVLVGPEFQYEDRPFRECTYEADPTTVATLRKRVLDRARNSEDVNLWRAINDVSHPTTAPNEIKFQRETA